MPADTTTASGVRERLSFDQVYQRHFDFVWRLLRASGLPVELIEDAAQDVFVVIHRRLPQFEGRSDIRTWLFRITMWIISGERKRLRMRPAHEDIDEAANAVDEAVQDKASGPFEIAARGEAIRILEEILAQMTPEKRMAFLLVEIEGMTAPEVAKLLETNLNTVYSRLRLGREQFQQLLEKYSESKA